MALPIGAKFNTMKKNILLFTSIGLFSLVFAACSNSATDKTTADSPAATAAPKDSGLMKQTAVRYTCKMHPEITSDKPGKCPKCGMDLVKKETVVKDSATKDIPMDSTKH